MDEAFLIKVNEIIQRLEAEGFKKTASSLRYATQDLRSSEFCQNMMALEAGAMIVESSLPRVNHTERRIYQIKTRI